MGLLPSTTAIKCGLIEKRRKLLSIGVNSMDLKCMEFNCVVMTTCCF